MTKPMLAAALAALSFARAGVAAPVPKDPAAAAKRVAATGVAPGYVDVPTADRLIAAGVTVVDVRTDEEFKAGHLPGALHIPFDEMSRRHGEIGAPATPVLVYCKSGRRSGIAADALRQAGFGAVYDMRSYGPWAAAHAEAK